EQPGVGAGELLADALEHYPVPGILVHHPEMFPRRSAGWICHDVLRRRLEFQPGHVPVALPMVQRQDSSRNARQTSR
ncbi:hypothetical protein, partial [Arthrobacter sp. AL12]|uniref:hypothetical protein n=1 Tax=Arthrobacter sp. AL12 TaxID=3042241 RepID=UPI00249A3259